jgi:hypothetical protein|mmetsp:Transcript_108441/g.171115  ORF Transcript_108441/g.171115 Transcript_108441/m.171115 type:complete len:316 (+) Transcript_108441:82-1029(+)
MASFKAVLDTPDQSSSFVSVIGINGDTLLGPTSLPISTSVADILLRVHDARKGLLAGCSKLLHDVQVLSDHTTLQQLKASSNVQLTVVFEQLPEEDRNHFIAKLLQRRGAALTTFKQFPDNARADESVVRVAIQQDGCALEFAHVRFRADKEFVMLAAQKSRHALQFASPNLQADAEVVRSAACVFGDALRYADVRLAQDKEFVGGLLRQNGSALECAHPSIKSDKELVRQAVRANGFALKFADRTLRSDKDVVLDAVRESGLALQYVDEALLLDKEVALAALQQSDLALKYINDDLKRDPDIVPLRAGLGRRWR